MKQNLLARYRDDIFGTKEGESFRSIGMYALPEFITNLIVYSMPVLLDAWFIGQLKSTATYAALGVTNTFLHLIIKMAEAFAVGTVIVVGSHNGAHAYKKAGKALRDSFWTTFFCGLVVALFLFVFAREIYMWQGLHPDVVELSIPFMRLRAVSVFLMFMYFALVGFLRGIKNTQVPMSIFIVGMISFICADYVFIFGKYGFEPMGLQGSALASIVQYSVMLCVSLWYVYTNADVKKYAIALFDGMGTMQEVSRLVRITVPVMLDKAIMALAYIWLCRMMATTGTCGVAAFCVVKDMERFALIPAIACAQVITFLVSNNIGAHRWEAVKTNIKRMLFIAILAVGSLLTILMLWPQYFIEFFDKSGDFTCLASQAFPVLSFLAFFDLLQLILAGALRGAGDVRTVMLTRLVICFGFFVPVSWVLVNMKMDNTLLQFILIYGSFYFGNGLMSIVYMYQFHSNRWKRALTHDKDSL